MSEFNHSSALEIAVGYLAPSALLVNLFGIREQGPWALEPRMPKWESQLPPLFPSYSQANETFTVLLSSTSYLLALYGGCMKMHVILHIGILKFPLLFDNSCCHGRPTVRQTIYQEPKLEHCT